MKHYSVDIQVDFDKPRVMPPSKWRRRCSIDDMKMGPGITVISNIMSVTFDYAASITEEDL